jgi:probable HAF family extracellular repeat protein
MRIRSGLLLALVLGAGHLSANVLYSVTDLGTNGMGFAINNLGQVTGVAYRSAGTQHAFLYSNGQMNDLGSLPGYSASVGSSINDAGQVVGAVVMQFVLNNPSHAFLYSNGQMNDLGSLPGYAISTVTDINNAGQVVGTATLDNLFPSRPSHAFLYSNGQMIDLTVGSLYGAAYGINEAGQVVGWSDGHVFLYSNGQMTNLGFFRPEGSTIAGRWWVIVVAGRMPFFTATARYKTWARYRDTLTAKAMPSTMPGRWWAFPISPALTVVTVKSVPFFTATGR